MLLSLNILVSYCYCFRGWDRCGPANLRADIDYGTYEALTTYGKIGIKVWVYNGMNYGIDHNEDAGQLVKKPRRPARQAAEKTEGSEPAKKARS